MDVSILYDNKIEINDLMNGFDDLIARAKGGDREAFSLIFEHHHRSVYKFIYGMLGEHSLAEELTQETFLGAYKGIHSLRGEAKLKTWLCGIAKNVVYKFLRSHNKKAIRGEDEVESLNLIDEKNPPPDKQFFSKELNRLIRSALEKLDEDKRLVFTLKELQNLSYQEISEITGYSIPKLKTDLHRAKNEMRSALRPYLEVGK